jgi:predicted phage terminase large subunit-like protein
MDESFKKLLNYSNNFELFAKEILDLQVKPYHKEWINLFENNNFVSLLAPRGHGKSIMVGSYIIWNILRNPLVRVLLVTINQDKANEMMNYIQGQLIGNQKILEIWGDQRDPAHWSKTSFNVLNKTGKPKIHREPTLTVYGVTGGMVGGHYEIIILDDITDQKNSRTEHRRNDLVVWYNQTLLPMRWKDGKVISIGTKWHELDIHRYFQKDTGYKSRVYKAVTFEPDDEQKAKGMSPQVLWNDVWPYDRLMEMKSKIGSVAFSMQFQNEVVASEDAGVRWDWIERARNGYDMPERPYKVYMGVDFASKGKDTDYFSISVIAIKNDCVYLIDSFRGNMFMNEQFDQIYKYDDKWNPTRIAVDSAAMQKAITQDLGVKYPGMPIVPVKPSIVNDKETRYQRLAALFEANRIFLRPDLTIYVDEIMMFPRGSHDDTLDSLVFAIQASFSEEELKAIDWDRIPSLIYSTKTRKGNVSTKKFKPKSYNVIKV